MEPGGLVEGGRLDEVGDVDQELQAEGKGIQAEDILGKARKLAVSTCATAVQYGRGEGRVGRGGGSAVKQQ